MKSINFVLSVILLSLSISCVVGFHPVPGPVTLSYSSHHGVRVLIVPPHITIGHPVIIGGRHCVVVKKKKHRVKVRYSDGRTSWITTR